MLMMKPPALAFVTRAPREYVSAFRQILLLCTGQPNPFGPRICAPGGSADVPVVLLPENARPHAGEKFAGLTLRGEAALFPPPRRAYVSLAPPLTREEQRLVSRLKRSGTDLFGGPLPDKKTVHDLLARTGQADDLLPYRRPLTTLRDLEVWPFPSAVVKPRSGSRGRGVRLATLSPPYILWGQDTGGLPLRKTYREKEDLLAALVPDFGRAFLEEPLPLHTPDGRPYDVRVILLRRKPYAEKPFLLACVVRLGLRGRFTANLHTGGTPLAPEEFRRRYPELWTAEQAERLRKAAERVGTLVFRLFPRAWEVGMDFGFRATGEPVLLEVNGTPGRKSLRALGADLPARRLAGLVRLGLSPRTKERYPER
ncbi:MAG: YheC/YheD family protein [Brockia lithotrophica]|nr:YheC/YheD family protein [Brockia lithotrophica]